MDKTGDIFDKKIKVLLGILNPQHSIDYPQYMVSLGMKPSFTWR